MEVENPRCPRCKKKNIYVTMWEIVCRSCGYRAMRVKESDKK